MDASWVPQPSKVSVIIPKYLSFANNQLLAKADKLNKNRVKSEDIIHSLVVLDVTPISTPLSP